MRWLDWLLGHREALPEHVRLAIDTSRRASRASHAATEIAAAYWENREAERQLRVGRVDAEIEAQEARRLRGRE